MKKTASLILVVILLLAFTSYATEQKAPDSTPRPICTIDEFVSSYNVAIIMLNSLEATGNMIFKENFKLIETDDYSIFLLENPEAVSILLACKKGDELVYSVSFFYLNSNYIVNNLSKPIASVLFATGLQDTIFDFSFEAMNGVGASGQTLKADDAGTFIKNGLTANWLVADSETGLIHRVIIFRYKNNQIK